MRQKKTAAWKEKVTLVFFLLLMAYLPPKIFLPMIWTGNESLYLAIRQGDIGREGADANWSGPLSRILHLKTKGDFRGKSVHRYDAFNYRLSMVYSACARSAEA
jgi:hypothetical protein